MEVCMPCWKRAMMPLCMAVALAGGAEFLCTPASAMPTTVGACTDTTIAEIGTRLEGMPDSGSAVRFADGGTQVSYETIRAIERSRVGDKVRVCLVRVPKHCPPGDDRGKVYRTTNLRNHEHWTLPDSEHACGGA